MALFLDTNIFIDLMEDRDPSVKEFIAGNVLFISTVSLSTYFYIYKISMPISESINALLETFHLVELSEDTCIKSFYGPTKDFEDNIQLHSAVRVYCKSFVTSDKALLDLSSYDSIEIISIPSTS